MRRDRWLIGIFVALLAASLFSVPPAGGWSLQGTSLNGNQEVLANPAGTVLYHGTGSSVDVVDARTGNVLRSASVGSRVFSLALGKDGSTLFAALPDTKQIVELNLTSMTVTRTVSVSFSPISVRVGRPDRLYASESAGDANFYVLDIATGNVLQTVNTFFTDVLEVDPAGSTLLAISLGTSPVKINKYDITNDVPSLVDADNHDLGSNFQQAAVDWTAGKLYTASGAPYGIEIVDLATMDRVGFLPMDAYTRGVALSPDGLFVYGLHSNFYDAALWAFNVSSGESQRINLTPEPEGLAVAGDGAEVYSVIPFQRLLGEPSILPAYPAANETVYTEVRAIEARVIHVVKIDRWQISLDGVDLAAFWYGTQLLHAELYVPAGSGTHRVSAAVFWSGGSAWANWSFTVDIYVSPPLSLEAAFPAWESTLDDPPAFLEARVWRDAAVELLNGTISLDSHAFPAYLVYPDTFHADISGTVGLGVHRVQAVLGYAGGVAETSWNFTLVMPDPTPPMVSYSDPAGFRLPVPQDWERQTNVSVSGTALELVLLGPVFNGFRTNIIVDTDRDSTVRETISYLSELVQSTLAEAQFDDPTASLYGTPVFSTVANHASVAFTLRYGSDALLQRMVVVVSEQNERYWFMLLTVDQSHFGWGNATLAAMTSGLEITLPSAGASGLSVLGVLGAALAGGLIAGLVALLVLRTKRTRAVVPPVATPWTTSPHPPAAPTGFCPRCGTGCPLTDRFCGRCGESLPSPPFSPRTLPPSRES